MVPSLEVQRQPLWSSNNYLKPPPPIPKNWLTFLKTWTLSKQTQQRVWDHHSGTRGTVISITGASLAQSMQTLFSDGRRGLSAPARGFRWARVIDTSKTHNSLQVLFTSPWLRCWAELDSSWKRLSGQERTSSGRTRERKLRSFIPMLKLGLMPFALDNKTSLRENNKTSQLTSKKI